MLNFDNYQVGDVLKIKKGPVWHYGVVIDQFNVVHASKKFGKVVCHSVMEFADGQKPINEGFIGPLNSIQVVKNAKSLLGRPYRLFSDNCEHLINQVHGLGKHSKQVAVGITISIGAGILYWLFKK